MNKFYIKLTVNANFSKYLKIFLSAFLLITILLSFSAKEDFISSFSSKGLIAKVGSAKIKEEDFDIAFQSAKGEILERHKTDFETLPDNQKIQFRKMVFENVLKETLMMNFARDLGLRVSDEVVAKHIKHTELFLDEKTGVFDKVKFKKILAQYGRTEREYVDGMKDGLAMYGLFIALNNIAKIDLPAENELIAKNLYRKRVIDLISVSEEKIDVEKPTEQEIRKFYDLNSKDFRSSGFRSIKYFILNKDRFLNKIVLDDSLVKQEIENVLRALPRRETRSFFNVICNMPEDTKKIHDHFNGLDKSQYKNAVKNRRTIEDMIWDNLKSTSCNIVELNDKRVVEIPEEFRKMVFDDVNSEKMIGEGRKTSAGEQIILLKDIKQLEQKDFDNQVREKMRQDLAAEMMYFEYRSVLEQNKKNLDLEELAKKYGAKVQVFDYFNDDGYLKAQTDKYILNNLKGFTRELIELTFTSKDDEIKGTESRGGEVMIFKLNDKKPVIDESTMAFETVREQINNRLITDKRSLESGVLIEKIFSDYKSGIKVSELKKKYKEFFLEKGVSVDNPELVAIGGAESKIDISIAKMVFDLKKNEGEAIKIDNLNKIAILGEWKETDIKNSNFVELFDMISDAIHRTETVEISEVLTIALKKRYNIKIYDKTLA